MKKIVFFTLLSWQSITWVCSLFFLFLLPVQAQQLATDTPDQIIELKEIQIIQPADILAISEKDHSRLINLQQQMLSDSDINQLKSNADVIIKKWNKIAAEQGIKNPERLSFQAQKNYSIQLSKLQKDYVEFKKIVVHNSSVVQKDRDVLRDMRIIWQETSKQSDTLDIAETMKSRIKDMIKEIKSLDEEESNKINTLLHLHKTISKSEEKVISLLTLYKELNKNKNESVFNQNMAPLWQGFKVSEEIDGIVNSIQLSKQNNLQSIKDFYFSQKPRISFDALFLIALLLVMHWLRQYREEWSKDDSLAAAVHVLSRPIASAILILIITAMLIFGETPPIIEWMIGLVIALISVRILYGLLPEVFRRPLIVIALLYTLLDIPALILDNILLERLIVFVLTVLALSYLLYEKYIAQISSSELFLQKRFLYFIIHIVMALLALSLLSNLSGFYDLSKLLTYGIIHSVFVGVLFFSSLLVIQSILTLLLRTRSISALKSVRTHRDIIQNRIVKILRLITGLVWVVIVLNEFHIATATFSFIGSILSQHLIVGSIDISLADIVLFVLTLWISIWISRFVNFLLEEEIYYHVRLPRGVPSTISMLTRYTIIGIGLMFAFSVASIELSKFAILAGALGVGIGFGLQNIVNNFVSGLILAFERPIQSGDTIQTGTLYGQVKRIGFRSSTVRTFEGAEVIVPNANLVSTEVTNWTLSDQLRRIEIPIGVEYGTDPERVIELLVETAKNENQVISKPEPHALFLNHGDSSLDFLLRFWISEFNDWAFIRSRVNIAINKALVADGIGIPFPQRDINLKADIETLLSKTD